MIILKPITIDDYNLIKLAEWRNNPKTKPALRSYYDTAIDYQKDWAEIIIKDKTCSYYFIFKDSDCIGYCGLDKIHEVNRTAEISLLIDPECWGKGYGKRAIMSLLTVGFMQLNINCIYAEVYLTTENIFFWKKCGFKLEGTMRKRKYWNNKYYDSYILSILKEEFLNG